VGCGSVYPATSFINFAQHESFFKAWSTTPSTPSQVYFNNLSGKSLLKSSDYYFLQHHECRCSYPANKSSG
jgi:hypothetical protein